MPNKRKNKLTCKHYINAIVRADGFLVKAGRLIGVSYQAMQNAIKSWPEVAEVYKTVCEDRLDMAESGLTKAVKKDKAWAIQFLLRYKGRNRGFAEKLISENTNTNKPIDLSNLSEKDLKDIKAIWEKQKKK